MLDYPNVISKLVLLLNAGMSMRQAFYKMSGDYKKKSAGKAMDFEAPERIRKNSVPPGFASKDFAWHKVRIYTEDRNGPVFRK